MGNTNQHNTCSLEKHGSDGLPRAGGRLQGGGVCKGGGGTCCSVPNQVEQSKCTRSVVGGTNVRQSVPNNMLFLHKPFLHITTAKYVNGGCPDAPWESISDLLGGVPSPDGDDGLKDKKQRFNALLASEWHRYTRLETCSAEPPRRCNILASCSWQLHHTYDSQQLLPLWRVRLAWQA